MKENLLIALLLLIASATHAIEKGSEGNFKNQRTPGSYFAFGQNITDKGTYIPYLYFGQQRAFHEYVLSLTPALTYGITDDFSFFAYLPIYPKLVIEEIHTYGVGDLHAQFEYALINKETNSSTSRTTIVASVIIPTAHASHNTTLIKPFIGDQSMSFFIGTTNSYLSNRLYGYASLGGIITTQKKNTKIGSSVLYQCGGGIHLGNPFDSTLMALVDINGVYQQKNMFHNLTNPNSGGNIIYAGPSLYISKGIGEVVGGFQLPVLQHWYGKQNNEFFRVLVSASVQF